MRSYWMAMAATLVALCLAGVGCHEGSESGPCTDVDCSGYGSCVEESSEARCVCHAGFHDEGLTCVENVADGDADGDSDADADADGDGDADADEDTGPREIQDFEFCNAFVELLCEARLACCAAASDGGETMESCRVDTMGDCTVSLGAMAVDPELGYSPTRAYEELEEARSYAFEPDGSARCGLELFEWYLSQEGLLSILRGSVAAEALCGGWIYEVFNTLTCGPDRTCWPEGAEARCQTLSEAGGDCYHYFDCVDGLTCSRESVFVVGTCVARSEVGASCIGHHDCATAFCDIPGGSDAGGTCAEPVAEDIYCAPFFDLEGYEG